jgi:DNA-binding transcriptional MocR family regulator
MESIRSRIASRACPPGTRLPSVRAQAKAMGVSVSTVVEAYERLAAEQLIAARAGSGFYVSGPIAPLSLSRIEPRLDREVDPLWISRQSLEAGARFLKPGCGWLPASWMYEQGVRRALRATARAEDTLLADYATPLGLPGLRELLSRRLAAEDIQAPPGQIMLTDSGTQAIDLVCRFLLEPGDTVLVDDPCYFNYHALLRAHRAKAVGVEFTPDGPDIPAFEAALREHSPRLYITNSGIHNPTGARLASVTGHRLVRLAEEANLVIVEDDIFAEFETAPAPRLAAFDGLSRVIQIGSFSKTLSASLRCGYIAARADWIDALTDLKIATSFGAGQLAAAVALAALTDGNYRRHMQTLRQRLSVARAKTLARLEPMGITPWIVPRAGMFLWCRLPAGADAAQLTRFCLERGMVLAPGNAFSQSAQASRFLRFNAAQTTGERVFELLAQALAACA